MSALTSGRAFYSAYMGSFKSPHVGLLVPALPLQEQREKNKPANHDWIAGTWENKILLLLNCELSLRNVQDIALAGGISCKKLFQSVSENLFLPSEATSLIGGKNFTLKLLK